MTDQEDIILPPMPTETVHTEVDFLTIDQSMKATWLRIKERFWTLIILNAIPYIFTFILSLVAVLSLASVFRARPDLSIIDIPILVFTTGIVSFCILVGIVWSWSLLALIAAASNPVLLPIRDAYRQTKGSILPFWSIGIIMGIIIAGSMLFFIIPGIIFSVFFVFWMFTFLLEGERGMNALLKSREYIRGQFWKVVGYLLMLAIINIIFSILISIFHRISPGLGSFVQILEYLTLPVFSLVYLVIIFQRFQMIKGGMVFTPSTKQKAGYLVVGLLGWAIIAFFAIGTVFFFKDNPQYLNQLKQLQEARENQMNMMRK